MRTIRLQIAATETHCGKNGKQCKCIDSTWPRCDAFPESTDNRGKVFLMEAREVARMLMLRGGREMYRPIQEKYFRNGYELVLAPTEAQKEQERCDE